MSTRGLRDGVDIDRFEVLGCSTKHKNCPSCDGKIAVHYSGRGDESEGDYDSSFPQQVGI